MLNWSTKIHAARKKAWDATLLEVEAKAEYYATFGDGKSIQNQTLSLITLVLCLKADPALPCNGLKPRVLAKKEAMACNAKQKIVLVPDFYSNVQSLRHAFTVKKNPTNIFKIFFLDGCPVVLCNAGRP